MYDTIIIGSGLGGIMAGINLASHKEKVLILEKNDIPGGLVSTIKKGRFEFDTSLYEILDYGDDKNEGSIQKLLKKFGIEASLKPISLNTVVLANDQKTPLEIKGNFLEFMEELKQEKNGKEPLEKLLSVVTEIHEQLNALKKGEDTKVYQNETFLAYLDKNANDALESMHIPKDIIHKLSYFWLTIGSPLHKLNFIDYAEYLYQMIHNKVSIVKGKNMDFVLSLIDKYQELGGVIYYRSNVTSIKEKENTYEIKTKDGKVYETKNIISNPSKRYFLKELMEAKRKEEISLENARTMSPSGFIVMLGLNADIETIGLKYYHYYHYQTMNSIYNIKTMTGLFHPTLEAFVPNVVEEYASPKNTSILILKQSFLDKTFDKLNIKNKDDIMNQITKNLIHQFEEIYHIDISPYIEEIEVMTPFDIVNHTNNINGSMYGYARWAYDNSIHRILSYEDEKLPNIRFVGNASIFGGGAHNALYSGYFESERLEKEGKNGK